MSADTPREPSTPQPHRADQEQHPGPDTARRADQAPFRQQADAGRPGPPEHILSRAEYNEARRADPLVQKTGDTGQPGDDGYQRPGEAPARGAGDGADRYPGQRELLRVTGSGSPGHPVAEIPSRTEYNEARHARPPIERAGTPPERRDHDSSWPPSQADLNSARALYREYLRDRTTADLTGPGRERGSKAVGEKDDESPGEASGRPPTGPELLEAETKDGSRGDKFRRQVEKDIGDVIDLEKTGVETVKDLMARPSPTGHPEVPVSSGPVFGPDTPQHAAVDPSAVAEMTMVVGVIAFQAGRWIHHKMERPRKE